ncbi:MAG: isopenicillin N synthase-like dioxygenase [Candidatus Midichloriaceae bacterium]|jgi:isopenicillin N synthase-like dioxygenase
MIKVINFQSQNLGTEIHDSFKETGFAVITNHGIDFRLINQVYEEWKFFFKQSVENKKKYIFSRKFEKVQDGYFPFSISEIAKDYDVKDLKEFYHYSPGGRDLPQGITRTGYLYSKLMELALILLSSLNEETPKKLAKSLNEIVDDQCGTIMRILHYPSILNEKGDGAMRAAPHKDINLITLLVAATQSGLCVKDVDGNWHKINCNEHDIIINCGDMMQELTDNYYKSTYHKVVNPIGSESKLSRYSIPFFVHPKLETILSDRHTAKSFLDERLKENGLL